MPLDLFNISNFGAGTHESQHGLTPVVCVPVLIIGGGPAGLFEAYMLSKLGVRSLIVERYETRLAAPKAHALSPRSLEICRQFGLDINQIRGFGTNRKDAYWVNFVTKLGGVHVGRLPYERMDPKVLDATPTMIHNVPQPKFEEIITAELASNKQAEIRKNHSFVSLQQTADKVITKIENRTNGSEYEICSQYVIACDGARSKVRSSLGVVSDGADSYETMMTIHFSADLRPIVGENVGMLHWVMDPEVSGFIIGYDLSDNQVLICNFNPKVHPVDTWDEALCRKTVTAAIGQETKFEVLSYRPWVLSRKVAQAYQIDRVFLAGDAAHSFPPTGGLGLNSGLGDVHNLAYKIAAALQGWGGERTLQSYQFDRRQVALVNSAQSIKNGQKIFGFLKSLGATDPNVATARQNLYATIADPAAQPAIEQGIESQREHFDNLGLHIGYVYGDRTIPENASVFQPKFVVGARLPHAWIALPSESDICAKLPAIDSSYATELSPEEVAIMQYSTLDLCPFNAFALIYDYAYESHWRGVLSAVQNGITSKVKFAPVAHGSDFRLQPTPAGKLWLQSARLQQGIALLVRPDQHILAVLTLENGKPDFCYLLGAHLS
ncbi:FAD binding domain-containing protein [Limtongia smithiae]|uniref:FAD binding domain-containing protein n=1 Tax=Limtongia smithiae TaxID=1125753 RepID=UPI0034CEB307